MSHLVELLIGTARGGGLRTVSSALCAHWRWIGKCHKAQLRSQVLSRRFIIIVSNQGPPSMVASPERRLAN